MEWTAIKMTLITCFSRPLSSFFLCLKGCLNWFLVCALGIKCPTLKLPLHNIYAEDNILHSIGASVYISLRPPSQMTALQYGSRQYGDWDLGNIKDIIMGKVFSVPPVLFEKWSGPIICPVYKLIWVDLHYSKLKSLNMSFSHEHGDYECDKHFLIWEPGQSRCISINCVYDPQYA